MATKATNIAIEHFTPPDAMLMKKEIIPKAGIRRSAVSVAPPGAAAALVGLKSSRAALAAAAAVASSIVTFRNTEPTQVAIDLWSQGAAAVKDGVQRLWRADEEKSCNDERKAAIKAAAQEQKRADKAASHAKHTAAKSHQQRKDPIKEVHEPNST